MTSHSSLLAAACARPPKLYRYSQRQWLERSLQLGEFLLRPTGARQSDSALRNQILPFAARRAAQPANYLTLSLANAWDDTLFDTFAGADCCLVVHQAEEFGERLHRAVQRVLPGWVGIDAAVSYGLPSPLGAVFSKSTQQALEQEWLFAWRPLQRELLAHPLVIRIGSMEGIAELRSRAA